MNILSIDSGVERTGFCVFRSQGSDPLYVTSGLIKTSKLESIEIRLKKIYSEIKKILEDRKISLVILEQLFFFKNQKTVIKVSQAQGVILLLAAQNNIPVEFLTPLQIKQSITGYGQADKKSIQKMLSFFLKLDKKFTQDDEADAVACGLAYCFRNRHG